jgi:hypothetical protein
MTPGGGCRVTVRETGDPHFEAHENALGEKELVRTTAGTTNYSAVYLRYTVPTSDPGELHETVALLSPAQPLTDAFRFVAAASRPPTQLARWREARGAGAGLDTLLVDRRNRLRSPAAERATLSVFDLVPPPNGMELPAAHHASSKGLPLPPTSK